MHVDIGLLHELEQVDLHAAAGDVAAGGGAGGGAILSISSM